MAVPNPNPNPSVTPPTLTAAQIRALLHTLLSLTPNAVGPNSTPLRPAAVKAVRQQPVPQQTITIDASTRVIGHCNSISLASAPSMDQAVNIEDLLRGVFHPMGQGEERARAKADVNLSVTIQAGVKIMGSKNTVVCSGKGYDSKETTIGDEPLLGRKRRAESEPADMQTALRQKVKAEA